jgi:hypothetical protein
LGIGGVVFIVAAIVAWFVRPLWERTDGDADREEDEGL